MKTKLLLSVFLLCTVLISNGQWIYTDLSAPRARMGAAVLGTKAYFAGGVDYNQEAVSTIQVYDVKLENWDTTLNLSVPRMHLACVAAGNKLFFAGGANMGTMDKFAEVDIWDTVIKQWTYEQLTEPRVFLSAVSNSEKVLFAGGTNLFGLSYNVVEIFDAATGGLLTTTTLSLPRSCMGAAVIGDLAFFAGGAIDAAPYVTDRVDIYHFSTGTWTMDNLSEARGYLSAVTVGNKVIFAGGTNADNEPTDRVDIYDASDSSWSIASLSEPRALFPDPSSASLCDKKAYFSCGGHFDFNIHNWTGSSNVIDIYDASNDTWTHDYLTQPMLVHAVAGVRNHFIVAGGEIFYGNYTSNVEIFIDPEFDTDCVPVFPGSIGSPKVDEITIKTYPNPCSGILHIDLNDDNNVKQLLVTIYDLQGKEVFHKTLAPSEREMNLNLPSGMYVLRVIAEDKVYSKLITKQK